MKIKLKEDTKCAGDLHEMFNYYRSGFKSKPALPAGTVLDVEEEWHNFYGRYYRCKHENGTYDIPVSSAFVVG